MSFSQKAVLLGLAEVKMSMRHLTNEERNEISQMCYERLLDPEENEQRDKYIGVVDSFYALQEVTIEIDGDICKVLKGSEIILEHNLRNVQSAVPATRIPSRLILISQTRNFGRAALVLELFDEHIAKKLVDTLIKFRQQITEEPSNNFRRGHRSFGKSVHKKLNTFLTSLHSTESMSTVRSYSAPVTPADLSEEEDDYRYSDSDDEDNDSSSDSHDLIIKSPSSSQLLSTASKTVQAEIEFLLESELTYLQNLKKVKEERTKLEHSCTLQLQHHFLFRGLDELLNLHNKLYKDLCNAAMDTTYQIPLTFLRHTNDFEIYVSFISNAPFVDRANLAVKEFPRDKFSIVFENLKKPRMRLNYYVLTLESLEKHCTGDEQVGIMKSIEMLKGWLKEADSRLILDSIKDAPFELRNFGLVNMFGELNLKKGPGLDRKRYQVLLLETILVLAEGKADNCNYVGYFKLEQMEMVHKMRGLYFQVKIRRSQKPQTLAFKAKSVKLQQKWINALNSQINKVNTPTVWREVKGEEYCLSSSDSEATCIPEIVVDSYDSNDICHPIEFPVIPPLSFWTALSQVAYSHEYENEYNFDTCLLHLERNVCKFVSNFQETCSQCPKHKDTLGYLRQFYELYLLPAIHDYFQGLHQHLLFYANQTNLERIVGKLFYYFSVKTYESNKCCPTLLLFTIESLLCLRHTVFCDTRYSASDSEDIIHLNKFFDRVIDKTNDKLKKRYISNMPNSIPSKIVYEGLLHFSISEDINNYGYGVLTEKFLHIFSIENQQLCLQKTLDVQNGKLGNPPGISSFQLVLRNEEGKKVRYNCQCPTLRQKNDWLVAFDQIFSQQNENFLNNIYQPKRRLSYELFRKVHSCPMLESQL